MRYIMELSEVSSGDVETVGGKNASLGEMIQHLSVMGINVPGGFATTTLAYKTFLSENNLDKKITKILSSLNVNKTTQLEKCSKEIRSSIMRADFSNEFKQQITQAYAKLKNVAVAVRSSATAEDLATASFAGQQETYLNIKGIQNVLHAIKMVFASLYTSRAISYREHHRFEHDKVLISVGIQPMIRSDKGASGVIFTLDTESGFDRVVLITAAYGLGEAIVQGQVNPDEYYVSKPLLENNKHAILQRRLGSKAVKMVYDDIKNPRKSIKTIAVPAKDQIQFCLSDAEITELAKQALIIEKHYDKRMDIEWAKDGVTGDIYILQARPETVKSQVVQTQQIERYALVQKGKVIVEGQSIGQRIGKGIARVIANPKDMHSVKAGEVLVTDMTDPDWEPVMKRAAAIVTNRGGRTCHAAIIARELGIPAVVGCGNATKLIKNNQPVTVSCAEGQTGYVYSDLLEFDATKVAVDEMPNIPLNICVNMGNPERAFATQFLPNGGVGLARLEFIISDMIGIHPNALLNFEKLPTKLKQQIKLKTAAYKNPIEFYVAKLTEGIAMIAAAFYPKQVIFRFSDFKSNEYANLLGGDLYEPHEENPMIGFRGASRYIDKNFRSCFELECKAFKYVREKMGLTNAQVMVPFVRTVNELREVIETMQTFGMKRGEHDLKVFMMCEIPSNALLAAEYLQYVDGYSIGSNDLTQLTLGLDRDSNLVSALFDERDAAVKTLLHMAITECKKQGKYIGICGQGPSDYPDFAEWLMNEGIESISLNPDTILETWLRLAKAGVVERSLSSRA